MHPCERLFWVVPLLPLLKDATGWNLPACPDPERSGPPGRSEASIPTAPEFPFRPPPHPRTNPASRRPRCHPASSAQRRPSFLGKRTELSGHPNLITTRRGQGPGFDRPPAGRRPRQTPCPSPSVGTRYAARNPTVFDIPGP
ncbi:hypothetical protein QBC39DRAFT_340045 [Podospora conica]|nr:hypothetical protein QBC39DRAFT_340045 [Schizothecium conicum]